ncbi:MAG: hypothetical protein AAF646_14705 [Pseudomonadota bacterium]
MADTAELERRLAVALERIETALDTPPAEPAEDTGALTEAQEQRDAALEAAEKALAEADDALSEVESLKHALEAEATAAAQLRERVQGLKELKDAQAERIVELEAEARMTAEARAADRAELDALIAALEPLVKEARHA